MEIIFRMTVRNMLPETINKALRRVGGPPAADEHTDIQLQKVVEWSAVPGRGDQIWVLPEADHRTVQSVVWGVNGVVEVELDVLDTDEVADEEAVAVEALLGSGWTIDWGLPWTAPDPLTGNRSEILSVIESP